MKINKLGFTLIEILIVIALAGIIAAGILALINPVAQLQKGRDSQRIADMKKIQAALELYRIDNGGYPGSIYPRINEGSVIYMPATPNDPNDDPYTYTGGGSTYAISKCAENEHTQQTEAGSCSSGRLIIFRNP